MSVRITSNYLTPMVWDDCGTTIKVRVLFYDTELAGTPDDGRLIAELTGCVTGGSFTFTDSSDMMSSGTLTFVVDDVWKPILSVKNMSWWFRGKIKVFKIYHDNETDGEIEIPFGVYTVGSNSWSYNENTYSLSMTLTDLMESLTADKGCTIIGRAGGHTSPSWAFNQFETIRIEAGVDIQKTLTEFTENYAPFAYEYSIAASETVGTEFPYEMDFDSSSGLYEVFEKVKGLAIGTRMRFDINGVFRFETEPMKWEESCHILGRHVANLVISEERTVNADAYRNAIAVWGKTIDITTQGTTSYVQVSLTASARGTYYIKNDDGSYSAVKLDGTNFDSTKTYYKRTTTTGTTASGNAAVGKYFGVATDYSNAYVEDTRCEVITNEALCSNDLCRELAEYELYKRNRLTETLTVTIVDRCLPMYYQITDGNLGVGEKFEYTSVITGETDVYILSELSNDLASGTVTLKLDKFYEFYPDRVKLYVDNFDGITYTYTVENNIIHFVFSGNNQRALFKFYVDNVFFTEVCTDTADLVLDEGSHYIEIRCYNPMIKPADLPSIRVKVGDAETFNLLAEDGNVLLTERKEQIITE